MLLKINEIQKHNETIFAIIIVLSSDSEILSEQYPINWMKYI